MASSAGVEALISEAYDLLAALNLDGARQRLEKALSADFDDAEVIYAMKCASWWTDAVTRMPEGPFEAGEFAIGRWKAFRNFASRLVPEQKRPLSSFKHFAFGLALAAFQRLETGADSPDAELSLRLGRAFKGKGDYIEAVKRLESAAKLHKDDAAVIAELADAYALVDELRPAKALFREAFLINPQRIELELLESGLAIALVDETRKAGKLGIEAAEWIPVLGELGGALSVKRELKPIEAGKLRQSIYELETELSADPTRRPVLVPRLINKYFWLIDHYVSRKEERSKVDELLLKIKLLDPAVYKQYIT